MHACLVKSILHSGLYLEGNISCDFVHFLTFGALMIFIWARRSTISAILDILLYFYGKNAPLFKLLSNLFFVMWIYILTYFLPKSNFSLWNRYEYFLNDQHQMEFDICGNHWVFRFGEWCVISLPQRQSSLNFCLVAWIFRRWLSYI